ncbi:MAG: hypothetical protein F6K24_05915 [Okeania sp. SIO2D1]|nr:hypothetical protein [Okeania sp. SIO2D1]
MLPKVVVQLWKFCVKKIGGYMTLLMQTKAVFHGCKVGQTKSGEPWKSYLFKAPELYKGVVIASKSLSMPNMFCFPTMDEFDDSVLIPGAEYQLQLEVSARIRQERAYPEFRLHGVLKSS